MRYLEIEKYNKLILSIADISKLLSISKESAYVTANRYVKQGFLIRLKRDFYITVSKFNLLSEEQLFEAANILQTPSYISLGTALSYYDIATQQQRYYIESAALKRSLSFKIGRVNFNFTKFKKEYYCGFIQKENFFIALPEKALADIVYLTSINKYSYDFTSIEFKKVNKKRVSDFLVRTNPKTMKFWRELCNTYRI